MKIAVVGIGYVGLSIAVLHFRFLCLPHKIGLHQ